jgi:hypothetical protein
MTFIVARAGTMFPFSVFKKINNNVNKKYYSPPHELVE